MTAGDAAAQKPHINGFSRQNTALHLYNKTTEDLSQQFGYKRALKRVVVAVLTDALGFIAAVV